MPLSSTSNSNSQNAQLSRKLFKLREGLAHASGKELFKILHNETIEAIATARPTTLEELKAIKGLGPKKIADFGAKILALVEGSQSGSGDTSNEGFDADVAASKISTAKISTPHLEKQNQETVLSVSAFLDQVNATLVAQKVLIHGEISKVSLHQTGVYFDLKDTQEERCLIHCYISPGMYRSLGITLEEGLEIKAGGFPRMYKPRGEMSFQIEHLELFGEGSLKKSYEMLKKKLELEGLFDRKRALPQHIEKIGLITSRTGAVIDDFRKNLEPLGCRISFCDVRVEGASAVGGISSAVRWFNRAQPDLDVIVIIRGGGSWEDLQPFNNELVARTIFASRIPTICGIGHDRDVPIASLVADYAPSTPTASAHAINQSWQMLRQRIPLLERQLLYSYESALQSDRATLQTAGERLFGEFKKILLKYAHLSRRLGELFQQHLEKFKTKIASYDKYLAAVSPERNLKLGYSILFNGDRKVIKHIEHVRQGETLSAKLIDGEVFSQVTDIQKDNFKE